MAAPIEEERPGAEAPPVSPVAREKPRRRAIDAWPYVLIAFLYFATWPFHHGLNNPNEMVRVYMTKALADEGTPIIDRVVARWGGVDDKAIRDGKLYSSKAPLQSYLGVPGYWWSKALDPAAEKRIVTNWLRRFASALPGAIFAFALLAWSRRRSAELGASRRMGTGIGLALALGTMLYPYALTFTGHVLAAITAGGAYYVVLRMSGVASGTPRWRALALLAGFLGGAAPFAEYPAALVALPALLAAITLTPGLRSKLEVLGWLFLGGIGPFAFGLYTHQASWGSPLKTGYAFLENRAYEQLHSAGFFGVGPPSLEAFAGALFSPGTGLFFYSPLLAIGLVSLLIAVFRRGAGGLPRSLAIAGLIGCALEFLFIAGHAGWRGGWTVGPRYIIPVAPVLGLWVIEATRWPLARRLIPPLAAASIVFTGFAAALYPHLSDVYTNPLAHFLWPSYVKGFTTYGLGHSLGFERTAANLFHVVPLAAATLYALLAFTVPSGRALATQLAISTGLLALLIAVVALIPERDRGAAQAENDRLWGFWEPKNTPRLPPGFLFRSRDRWRSVRVESEPPGEPRRGCTMQQGVFDRCFYGPEPWHHFGPDHLDMNGQREPILFLHPIRQWVVRATIPIGPGVERVVLKYGLADASVASDNDAPVELTLRQHGTELARAQARNERGLHALELTLTSTAPLTLELRCERDGARVFGFDLEAYRE